MIHIDTYIDMTYIDTHIDIDTTHIPLIDMVCMYLRLADEHLCILLSSMQIADAHARANVHPKSTSKSPQSKETRQNIYNKVRAIYEQFIS